MHQYHSRLLITSGVCLMFFPFLMLVAEVIFIDLATKLGISPRKYPRFIVSSFRFFNGHVKSTGAAILSLGVLLTIIGVYQFRKQGA